MDKEDETLPNTNWQQKAVSNIGDFLRTNRKGHVVRLRLRG